MKLDVGWEGGDERISSSFLTVMNNLREYFETLMTVKNIEAFFMHPVGGKY
jgi:hypothetical protein